LGRGRSTPIPHQPHGNTASLPGILGTDNLHLVVRRTRGAGSNWTVENPELREMFLTDEHP
jgi:hypothetical protein